MTPRHQISATVGKISVRGSLIKESPKHAAAYLAEPHWMSASNARVFELLRVLRNRLFQSSFCKACAHSPTLVDLSNSPPVACFVGRVKALLGSCLPRIRETQACAVSTADNLARSPYRSVAEKPCAVPPSCFSPLALWRRRPQKLRPGVARECMFTPELDTVIKCNADAPNPWTRRRHDVGNSCAATLRVAAQLQTTSSPSRLPQP